MKYIYAIVKIPMELTSNGKCNMLSDRIHTTIEPCHDLPPINEDHTKGIYEQIQQIIEVSPLTNVDNNTSSNVDDIDHIIKESDSEPAPEPASSPAPAPEPEPAPEPAPASSPAPAPAPEQKQETSSESEPVQIKLILNTPHNSSDHKHNMTFRNTKIKQNKSKKIKPSRV